MWGWQKLCAAVRLRASVGAVTSALPMLCHANANNKQAGQH